MKMFLAVEMDAPSAPLSVAVLLSRKVMRCRIFAGEIEAAHALFCKLAGSCHSCQGTATCKDSFKLCVDVCI